MAVYTIINNDTMLKEAKPMYPMVLSSGQSFICPIAITWGSEELDSRGTMDFLVHMALARRNKFNVVL
jgi:hypothetical protein